MGGRQGVWSLRPLGPDCGWHPGVPWCPFYFPCPPPACPPHILGTVPDALLHLLMEAMFLHEDGGAASGQRCPPGPRSDGGPPGTPPPGGTVAAARGFVLTGPGRELWARRCGLRPTKWERRGAAKPTCLETQAPSQRQGRTVGEQNEGRRGAESLEGFPGEVSHTPGMEGTVGRGKSQPRTPVQGLGRVEHCGPTQ